MAPDDEVEEVLRDDRPGTFDHNRIIGETPDAMEKRALFAGWATEFRRMCGERDEDQLHLYAFCAVKCIGSFLSPVVLDELRGAGGESPDRILTMRLMEIYLKLGEKLGIECGVVPVAIINKIAADPTVFPPAIWPATTVGDLSDQNNDVLIVGDSSIATMGENRVLRPGSFLEELLVFTGRNDSGSGAPKGLTEIHALPGGGVRTILNCVNRIMQDLRARGRNPHKSLRVIVCWQFEEFFMPYGMMKTAFPFELQQDIAALAEVMNGLRSITILGAQSQIWGSPHFTTSGPT